MIKEVACRELQGIPSFSVVAVSWGAGKDHATAVKERYRQKQKHFGSLLTSGGPRPSRFDAELLSS
jgi:hypothetical protein